MAPLMLGNSEEISIYAEFISSLSVANIFVGFQSAPGRLRVRRVSVGRRSISVTLVETGSDCPEAALLLLSVPLPNCVTLLPNTCSSLQSSPFGWLLRLNMDEIPDDRAAGSKRPQGPLAPRCRSCNSGLLRDGASISTVLPLADLGLPPGMDWGPMGLTYFCHDHGHGNSDEGYQEPNGPRAKQEALLAPRPNEVFTGDAANVFSAKALDFSRLTVSAGGAVSCCRCRAVLGRNAPKCGAVQLHCDAVLGSADDDLDKVLAAFVEDCSQDRRRIRVSLQDSDDTLLLWIMDRNLKTFQAHLGETSQRWVQRDVCKILYKHEKHDSPLSVQWSIDSGVKLVTVHESMLTHLLTMLLSSTESLPMAWRYANDFCMGYLNV